MLDACNPSQIVKPPVFRIFSKQRYMRSDLNKAPKVASGHRKTKRSLVWCANHHIDQLLASLPPAQVRLQLLASPPRLNPGSIPQRLNTHTSSILAVSFSAREQLTWDGVKVNILGLQTKGASSVPASARHQSLRPQSVLHPTKRRFSRSNF